MVVLLAMSRVGTALLTGIYIPKTGLGCIAMVIPLVFIGLMMMYPKMYMVFLVLLLISAGAFIYYLVKQV